MEYREVKYRREISGSIYAELTVREYGTTVPATREEPGDWDTSGDPEYSICLMVFGKEVPVPADQMANLISSLEDPEFEISTDWGKEEREYEREDAE